MNTMPAQAASQTQRVCDYIAATQTRDFPPDVLDEARKCLVDWAAVCIGAYGAPEAGIVRSVLGKGAGGSAPLLEGGSASPAVAAAVNATLSHCLDYDDTHIPSVVHVSGPVWAAILAVGAERGLDETRLLKAFVTGFEIAACIGNDGVGLRMNTDGWHATPVLGRIAAAGALAVVAGLPRERIPHALGIAAIQASGLTSAFGTMSKPFQIGKTAMDGVLAMELAEAGLTGPASVLDAERSFLQTLFQDKALSLHLAPFEAAWEIRKNSYKPYAACQLTHAAIDAARQAAPLLEQVEVRSARAFVNPLALKIAGLREPATTTQAKFSLAYCVALGLRGHAAALEDFTPDRIADPALTRLAGKVEVVADPAISRTSARLEIQLASGQTLHQDVAHARGSIGNPLSWADIDGKFAAVVTPRLGARAGELLQVLHTFERPGSLARLFELARISG